jgi:flagellar basal body-associated protein FliL
MSEENNTGNNLIWAITLLIVVAIIAGALYYSGFLSPQKEKDVNIEIKVPATSNSR